METGNQSGQEDLPSDGTCDACEPDEPQQAVKFCQDCNFAFCAVHADKHHKSSRHQLQDWGSTGQGEEIAPGTGEAVGKPESPEGEAEVDEGEEGAVGVSAEAAASPSRVAEETVEDVITKARNTATVERLRCTEHGQEGTLYCKPDEKIICVMCAVQGAHREHQIITLREAYLAFKEKEAADLLGATMQMAENIKVKWTDPNMGTEELQAFVHGQFDELHRLVLLEEKRALHLVDLKEAVAISQTAEKMAEISAQTEKLKEEMADITKKLSAIDHGEEPNPADMMTTLRKESRRDPPGSAGSASNHAP